MKKGCLIIVLLLLPVILCSCSSPNLSGHWVLQDEHSDVGIDDMILRQDGTGSVNGLPVSWSAADGTIRFTLLATMELNYSLSNNILKLYDENGISTYRRN